MPARKTPRVTVVRGSPLADAADKVASAMALTMAYNVRAALGQTFNPKLLDDARKVLASSLSDYGSALVAELLRRK